MKKLFKCVLRGGLGNQIFQNVILNWIQKEFQKEIIVSKFEYLHINNKIRNMRGIQSTVFYKWLNNNHIVNNDPMFIDQITRGIPLRITNPDMTRYIMTLSSAVDLVLFCFKNAKTGDLFVQKSPSSTVGTLLKAVLDILDQKNYPIRTIGTRHGEKLFETLVSKEEMIKAEDMGNYYRIPSDSRDLNYKIYYENGNSLVKSALESEEYNSHNTDRLDQVQIKEILLGLDFIKDFIKKNNV